MSRTRTIEPAAGAVVWHDLECGAYRADLELWRELADRSGALGEAGKHSDVLDLGCGTGRVSLDLAARGHRVTGLDLDGLLAEELRRRAADRNLAAASVVADARQFDLGRQFDLVLAAMQFLQLLSPREERIAALECARAHLRKRGRFAAALIDLSGESTDDEYVAPHPDMCESDGWVWSSQAVEIRVVDGGSGLVLDRHRRAVSPRGEIAESENSVRLELISADQLEGEMLAAGIAPTGRQQIPPTDDHVGSVVVFGEARDG